MRHRGLDRGAGGRAPFQIGQAGCGRRLAERVFRRVSSAPAVSPRRRATISFGNSAAIDGVISGVSSR